MGDAQGVSGMQLASESFSAATASPAPVTVSSLDGDSDEEGTCDTEIGVGCINSITQFPQKKTTSTRYC